MIAYHREVRAYLAGIGAEDVRITGGGKHQRLAFRFDGRERHMPISGSPGEDTAFWTKRRDIRRALGLYEPHRAGGRRSRRCRAAATPWRLPRLSGCVLPDWRETLARHPLACRCRAASPVETLIAAMLRHQVPGKIVAHPEIDAAFSALILSRPLRFREVRP